MKISSPSVQISFSVILLLFHHRISVSLSLRPSLSVILRHYLCICSCLSIAIFSSLPFFLPDCNLLSRRPPCFSLSICYSLSLLHLSIFVFLSLSPLCIFFLYLSIYLSFCDFLSYSLFPFLFLNCYISFLLSNMVDLKSFQLTSKNYFLCLKIWHSHKHLCSLNNGI